MHNSKFISGKKTPLKWVLRIGSGDSIDMKKVSSDKETGFEVPVIGGNGLMGFTDLSNTKKDTLIVGRVGAHCGNIHYIKEPSWVTDNALRISLTTIEINQDFLKYCLIALKLNQFANRNAQPLITGETVKSKSILLASFEEQRLIACFLDQKTNQIDKLIEQKEKLLKLLAEKRTTIITQAVTKGLDPQVKMKDSGIELLGNIPFNWKVSKIKFNGQTRYGLGEPPPKIVDGKPFIRATDIFRGKIDLTNIQFIDPDFIPWSKDPTLHEGEILVVRSGAYTGDSAIVTKECEGFIAGYDMVFTPKTVNSMFLSFVLLSKYMLIGQIYQARNRAAQPHLNAEELGNFIIALPPIEEQDFIAIYLKKYLDSTDSASNSIIQSISKLKEFREALISSAVTGQIDVRNYCSHE